MIVVEFDKILELINAVSKSNVSSFTLEEGNMKIVLERNNSSQITVNEKNLNNNFEVQSIFDPSEEQEKILGKEIVSPLVGTFYSAPSPDSKPFVKVGDTVEKGQIIGVIEAMKLMNEIEADCSGIVKEILVENESIVEYGQKMFVIQEEVEC